MLVSVKCGPPLSDQCNSLSCESGGYSTDSGSTENASTSWSVSTTSLLREGEGKRDHRSRKLSVIIIVSSSRFWNDGGGGMASGSESAELIRYFSVTLERDGARDG